MKKMIIGACMLLGLGACSNDKNAGNDAIANEVATDQALRLNVFYTANDTADSGKISEIAGKLVEASRNDAGCISYDCYQSVTVPGEFIIVETWENDSLLDIHSNAPHFAEYVPQLQSLGNMRAERFYIDK